MFFDFCNPPHSPPPQARAVARAGRFAPYGYATAKPLLSTPAGVERGAWIWLLRAGYAPTARDIATASSLADWQANGRRVLAPISKPRLAAAPARNETGLVHSRSQSDRCRWRPQIQPLTTTAGVKCWRPHRGGDASLHRSPSRNQKQNPGSLLYPGGGREGRGDEWGADQASQTNKASLQRKDKT